MMMHKLGLVAWLWLAALQALQAQTPWHPTQASVTFTIDKLGGTAEGSFAGFEGTLLFDPAQPERSRLEASVQTATLKTGIAMRDRHLRSDDYFHAERYPRIHMVSQSVRATPAGYEGRFLLTLKNVTRPVTMPFTFTPQPGGKVRFAGSLTINRRDFGVGPKTFMLEDEVRLKLVVDAQP